MHHAPQVGVHVELGLADRVAKRARVEDQGPRADPLNGAEGALSAVGVPGSTAISRLATAALTRRPQTYHLQLNLGAAELHPTPTRVIKTCLPSTLSSLRERRAPDSIGLYTNRTSPDAQIINGRAAQKIDLAPQLDPCLCPAPLHGAAVSSRVADRREDLGTFTWDDLHCDEMIEMRDTTADADTDVKVNNPEPIDPITADLAPHGKHAVSVSAPTTISGLDFKASTKLRVWKACSNASIGLESDLIRWHEPTTQLRVTASAKSSRFESYLQFFATYGSYVCRLRYAARAIREIVISQPGARTALALAASIDTEVRRLAPPPSQADVPQHLTRLYADSLRKSNLAHSLCVLIGCDDLEANGRLLSVPAAVVILERAFLRASLELSHYWTSEVLWRVVSSTLTPWLEQLNFLIGLTDPATTRLASQSMQETYFPELFITIDESGRISVDRELVPSFVPMDLAYAVLQCYQLLVILGTQEHSAAHAWRSSAISPLRLRHHAESPPSLLLSAQRPLNVGHGVNAVLKSLEPDSQSPSNLSTVPEGTRSPLSVELEIWRVLIPVSKRASELDLKAKRAMLPKLEKLANAVTGLFFLGNGQLWSLLQDPLEAMLSDWSQASALVSAMNGLVIEAYPDAGFVVDATRPGSLQLMYNLPATLMAAIPDYCLPRWQAAFNSLVQMHCENRALEFALFANDLVAASRRINETLHDPEGGLVELVRALKHFAGALADSTTAPPPPDGG